LAARLHPESLGELERSPDLAEAKGEGMERGEGRKEERGKRKRKWEGRERVKWDLPAPTEGDRRPL